MYRVCTECLRETWQFVAPSRWGKRNSRGDHGVGGLEAAHRFTDRHFPRSACFLAVQCIPKPSTKRPLAAAQTSMDSKISPRNRLWLRREIEGLIAEGRK